MINTIKTPIDREVLLETTEKALASLLVDRPPNVLVAYTTQEAHNPK